MNMLCGMSNEHLFKLYTQIATTRPTSIYVDPILEGEYVHQAQKIFANNLRDAGRYEEAAKLYEEMGEYEES
ncbi:MAG: hypothetical protein QXM65_03700 [Candidatus Bathyarchaeia archaeon]